MKKYTLTYKQLYDFFGNGEHESPCDVNHDIFVKTPSGFSKIDLVTTKKNHDIIRVEFEDGDSFECSTGHLFCSNGVPILANDAREVDSSFGKKKVCEITNIGVGDVYDISIQAPHWYIAKESSGVIHHNTFFALGICKKFLDDRPDAIVLYFDTEQAITSNMLVERGIDANRVGVFPVATVEEFRYQAIQIVDNYSKLPKSEKKPVLIVLDSLGMLSTKKEMEDTAEGKPTKDMTRTQVIKATFRTLTLKLGQTGIPMLITNHTYQTMGSMFPTADMSGGCLASGVRIITKNGTIPIEDVRESDMVLCKDNTFREVLQTHTFENKETIKITFEDGYSIVCTPEHKFLVDGEWIEAKNLSDLDAVDMV